MAIDIKSGGKKNDPRRDRSNAYVQRQMDAANAATVERVDDAATQDELTAEAEEEQLETAAEEQPELNEAGEANVEPEVVAEPEVVVEPESVVKPAAETVADDTPEVPTPEPSIGG